jgi:MFS family permease
MPALHRHRTVVGVTPWRRAAASPLSPSTYTLLITSAMGARTSRPSPSRGLSMIGIQRVLWGIAMVGTILTYRNHFHTVSDVNAAMADLSIWALATGVGFFAASAVTPPMAARFGVRRWMIVLTIGSAIFQAFPGSVFQRVTLVAASFLLGVASQSFKICTDTLVQAHIDDNYKGRVFVLYDMIFNASMVVAAVIAAFVLPADGVSVPIFLGLAVAYLALALAFTGYGPLCGIHGMPDISAAGRNAHITIRSRSGRTWRVHPEKTGSARHGPITKSWSSALRRAGRCERPHGPYAT